MQSRGTAPFHIRSAEADPATGQIRLHYGFDRGHQFVEEIQLPTALGTERSASFDAAVRLLLLVGGTSYYKSEAPTTIVVDVPTTAAERALVAELYDHGMREFAYTNGLDIPLITTFEWSGELLPEQRAAPNEDIGRPLVPFGGGKDSTVVLGLLPEAQPLTINGTSTHTSVAGVLGHHLLAVNRTIDRLDLLTAGLNGHIPITAIVSAISVVLAARDGFTSVVLANEAAANEPTLISDHSASLGRAVNHQWSKGATFEALFDAAVQAAGIPVRYFSMLRSMAEPQIIDVLSRQTDALPHIVSCNRAFAGRTAGGVDEAPQRWCGECPKCLFTFLMLATKLSPSELSAIFGSNLLENPGRTAGFAELWAPAKPLECVGERSDAAGALVSLSRDSNWSESPVVAALAESAGAALAGGDDVRLESDDLRLTPAPLSTGFQQRLDRALGR